MRIKVFQESFFRLTKPVKKNKFDPSRILEMNFGRLIYRDCRSSPGFGKKPRNDVTLGKTLIIP